MPRSERGDVDGLTDSATFSYEIATMKIVKVISPVEIYIFDDAARADTYLHECGHALDAIAEYITGYFQGPYPISNSAEWQDLYAKYGFIMSSFDSTAYQNMYNATEAFAEAFRLYFSYPQLLYANCPEIYDFVTQQIKVYTAYVPPLSYETFDYLAYSSMYPDVVTNYGSDKAALWNHYVNYGISEGRIALRIIEQKDYS